MNNQFYFLFAGDTYYPSGGWRDFVGRYELAGDAVRAAHQRNYDWWHVIDVRTGGTIESHNC
jgi:hypothetical protein